MAKYKIRTRQYCAIAKEPKWQSWLQSVSQELHSELMEHLSISKNCKSNHLKMAELQKKLEKRNLLPSMVMFLKKEYPFAIEEIKEVAANAKTPEPIKVLAKIKQGIFSHYNPKLLSFPQKAIIEDDNLEALKKKVRDFIYGKLSVDFIIIGNRAYIEYIKMKYAKEASQISDSSREIYKFRLKKGLKSSVKMIQETQK